AHLVGEEAVFAGELGGVDKGPCGRRLLHRALALGPALLRRSAHVSQAAREHLLAHVAGPPLVAPRRRVQAGGRIGFEDDFVPAELRMWTGVTARGETLVIDFQLLLFRRRGSGGPDLVELERFQARDGLALAHRSRFAPGAWEPGC